MKSGSKAASLLGTREWTRPARPTGRGGPEPSPPWRSGAGSAAGTACPGTAAWAPPHRRWGTRCWTLAGRLCQEDQAADLRGRGISSPPCPGGKSPSSLYPPARPAGTVWGVVTVEGKEKLWGSPSPSWSRLWRWLNCSANSVRDSSMVSVRGTDSEKRRLKFFILFMVGPGPAAGPEAEARRASRETRQQGSAGLGLPFTLCGPSLGARLESSQVPAPHPLPPCASTQEALLLGNAHSKGQQDHTALLIQQRDMPRGSWRHPPPPTRARR